ncbi:autophagy-related protein 13a isoform X1 [Helianthus annuus]|uniref:Putative autophagy-related protein 13 n=1 Tax=Helianthus annuus TaxID=4232 RepID=A0A251UF50_HELAN|nr:autophagy-related protein 13a isoform X1 [Helianthus annuus]
MELQYNNEHGRNDQIVSQFLLKTLHIVLESRVPSLRPPPSPPRSSSFVKKSDKWFNLALGDRPTAFTFAHRDPMIIDIILVQEMGQNQSGYGALVETVIERWAVQYEYSRASQSQSSESYKKTYKKSIILLRSLYSMMRLLPAYRAYRTKAKGKPCDFDITYKVSSFSVPFTRSEEQVMKLYTFFPVEAQHGHLSVSVKYRESLSDFNLETSATFPPEIITDYVGSPATDPFRAFPPVPQRPHSWTSGGPFTKNQSPPAYHSSSGRFDLSYSPSPSYDVYSQRTRQQSHHSFDDSPPFSPSPPMYLSSGGNYIQSRLRSETAPVSIPNPLFTRHLSPNLSDPNRHSLPPLSPRSTRYEPSSHESSPAIRSLKKSEMARVGDLSSASGSGSANHYSSSHKVSRDNKDDSGRFSGLLSSSGSPRIGFSRSSSRLSLQDELDDIDFSCPFIVDDVDTCDFPVSDVAFDSQSGAGGKQGKKSQDAAVGALVRMLRTAPPLRQDSSCCSDHVEAQSNASGLFMSRKTSDALEELKAYTGIKHLILSKSKDTL